MAEIIYLYGDGKMLSTICVKCAHFIGKPSDIWYNQLCRASKRQVGIDPVSGRRMYASKNGLGGTYYSNQKYCYCRDINKGNCVKFETVRYAEAISTW